MNTSSTQYLNSKRMEVYEPMHQFSMWGDFKGNIYQDAAMIIEVDTKIDNHQLSEDTIGTCNTHGPSNQCDQEASKPVDKALRRLAQNREAARKSRLRKKAYVQQLEASRLKLLHLEQELEQAKAQQCALVSSQLGFPEAANSGIVAFEIEYEQWVDLQNKKTNNLKTALNSDMDDTELDTLVQDSLNHYANLFDIKATVAKVDVCYLISGVWKTSIERLFLWIGGFRPSELLKVLVPRLELLDQQSHDLYNLIQACQQAEDSLSQGMEKLQQTLAEAVAFGPALGGGCYEMRNAMYKLEELVRLVIQADYVRQETLQQTLRYLTTRQAAQGLISLGEYLQRLRDLSSAWAKRLCEPPSDVS